MSTAMSSTPHHTTQPATFKQQRAQQRGMTLVELMVGITVGLLVTLAAIGTVYMTKVSSVTLVDSARLEQETNMVMNVIAEQIKQAGARNLEPSLTPAGGNADELLLPVRYQDFAGLNGASATQRKIVVQGKTNTPTSTKSLSPTASPLQAQRQTPFKAWRKTALAKALFNTRYLLALPQWHNPCK